MLPQRYGEQELRILQVMASVRLDGGIVSTSAESLVFIRAFMGGELFPRDYLEDMQRWQSIFFPPKAGVGLLKFELPWIFRPFQKAHPLLGHSGISGAFAFCSTYENRNC